jgi:multimeric flavodoxin WrbA
MKIIIINGSPHEGNTSSKITEIEKKLSTNGDADVEIINLKDMNILPCTGCFICFMKGRTKCPLKDDREVIEKKMMAADGVIFATPVYSMHVSYLLKTLIDRMAYIFHRPRFFNKYALTMSVAGNIGLKETNRYLSQVADAWGFEVVGNLSYRMVPKNTPMTIPPIKNDNTNEILERFYRKIKEKKPRKLSFTDHITFRLMQAVYKRFETMSPYDHQYWNEKGWFEKESVYFYSPVKRNIIYDLIAKFVAWMMGRQMDKEFVKK